MRKLYILKLFLAMVVFSIAVSNSAAQDTLAIWTFDQWTGGEPPSGQSLEQPIYANGGVFAATARVGSEYMFPDGGEGTVRAWGTPSAGGYVRTANMVVGTYYRIIGISSTGYRGIKVSANFGTDSSARTYMLQMRYRTGSEDAWVTVGSPVNITSTSQSSMARQFDNVELPAAANDANVLEIGFIVTSLAGAAPQGRVSDIVVTGTKLSTGISNPLLEQVRVYKAGDKMVISGATGSHVSIFSITGSKVLEINKIGENEQVTLNPGRIYIVRVNEQSFKVSM